MFFMKDVTSVKHLDDLDSESKYLVHKAKDATHLSYAPYSRFHVGAALLLDDGTLIQGANQENASYPLCMCAERVALYTAATQHPGKKITKLAVVAHKKNHKELVNATACGACRDVVWQPCIAQRAPHTCTMDMMRFPDWRPGSMYHHPAKARHRHETANRGHRKGG
jgi:cytidine deaminase